MLSGASGAVWLVRTLHGISSLHPLLGGSGNKHGMRGVSSQRVIIDESPKWIEASVTFVDSSDLAQNSAILVLI